MQCLTTILAFSPSNNLQDNLLLFYNKLNKNPLNIMHLVYYNFVLKILWFIIHFLRSIKFNHIFFRQTHLSYRKKYRRAFQTNKASRLIHGWKFSTEERNFRIFLLANNKIKAIGENKRSYAQEDLVPLYWFWRKMRHPCFSRF